MSKKTRSIVIAVAILLVLAIAAFGIYRATRPAPVEGQKTITVEVVHGDDTKKEFPITTTEETLRKALEQENLVQGDETDFGLYIKTVDGETADDAKQEWWALTKDGVMTETGADGVMIADGEHYELTFTIGW